MSFFLLVANWIVFCSLLLRIPSFPLVLPAKECKWVVLPRQKYCPHLISYPDLSAGSPDRVRSGYEISPDHLKSFNKVTTHLLCHHFYKAVVALALIDYFFFFYRYAELPRIVRVAQMPTDAGNRKKVCVSWGDSAWMHPISSEQSVFVKLNEKSLEKDGVLFLHYVYL